MSNYRIQVIMILFILINQMTIISAMFNDLTKQKTFIDVEKAIASYCEYETLLNLGQTNLVNHEKMHNLIIENHWQFLSNLKKKISDAYGLEEKVKILRDELLLIKEKYIQKRDSTNDVYRLLKNKNPNIDVIRTTMFFVTQDIMVKELLKPLKSYQNERYAIVFWDFLFPVIRHPYISKKDKKEIYKQIDSKVKKLKLPYYHGMTIGKLLKKKKHHFCAIF